MKKNVFIIALACICVLILALIILLSATLSSSPPANSAINDQMDSSSGLSGGKQRLLFPGLFLNIHTWIFPPCAAAGADRAAPRAASPMSYIFFILIYFCGVTPTYFTKTLRNVDSFS